MAHDAAWHGVARDDDILLWRTATKRGHVDWIEDDIPRVTDSNRNDPVHVAAVGSTASAPAVDKVAAATAWRQCAAAEAVARHASASLTADASAPVEVQPASVSLALV